MKVQIEKANIPPISITFDSEFEIDILKGLTSYGCSEMGQESIEEELGFDFTSADCEKVESVCKTLNVTLTKLDKIHELDNLK